MVRKLIDWSVANPLIVLLLTAVLTIGGGYAFAAVNIEAYPDPGECRQRWRRQSWPVGGHAAFKCFWTAARRVGGALAATQS